MKISQSVIILTLFLQTYNLSVQHRTSRQIDRPVRLTYVNKIANWWPPEKIASSMAVPEYAPYHNYNYVALAFWTYQHGALDAVALWDDPMKFFGQDNPFGKTKEQVQTFLKGKYNQHGVKILISVFGATEFPTNANIDPLACATKLASYVSTNNLDGVDIDWEDNYAMEAGTGERWLIAFTIKLRELLPSHIITHAPQAPYFCKEHYKNGGYVTVNNEVGPLIDFYNIQFYNQGNTTYDTYDKLFIQSAGYFPGTSVKEIAGRGVPLDKIVVGKPVTQGDATNTGWMDIGILSSSVGRAKKEGKWSAGVMFWQYSSDSTGEAIKTVTSSLQASW